MNLTCTVLLFEPGGFKYNAHRAIASVDVFLWQALFPFSTVYRIFFTCSAVFRLLVRSVRICCSECWKFLYIVHLKEKTDSIVRTVAISVVLYVVVVSRGRRNETNWTVLPLWYVLSSRRTEDLICKTGEVFYEQSCLFCSIKLITTPPPPA